MNWFFFIAGWFVGVGLGILFIATPGEKRKKYAIKVIAVFLGIFGGFFMVWFLGELVDHLQRKGILKEMKK